jgi:hypothetical protein
MFKEELADIGLIYRRKSNSKRFYATSSALQLATYKGATSGDCPASEHVVLLLNLFIRVEYLL